MKKLLYSFLIVTLSFTLLSIAVFADVRYADPGGKQPTPPGWYVRLEVDSCFGGCAIGIKLPNGTIEYAAEYFIENSTTCNWGGISKFCYVDYLTPDLEGEYGLLFCPPTGCQGSEIAWRSFWVKRMPNLESLEEKDLALEQEVGLLNVAVSSLQTRIEQLAKAIEQIVRCLLSQGLSICEGGSQRLIAYWKFDEGGGTTVFDETKNNNTGTIQGATWTTESISGYALEFDGIDDNVLIGQSTSLDLHNAVRIETWIKRDSTADGMVVSKNGPYYLAVRDNNVEGGVYVPSTGGWQFVRGVTDLQVDKWYQISMDYEGSRLRVLINGAVDAMSPVTGMMPSTGQAFFIGWGLPGQDQYFDGVIDEVKIYGA